MPNKFNIYKTDYISIYNLKDSSNYNINISIIEILNNIKKISSKFIAVFTLYSNWTTINYDTINIAVSAQLIPNLNELIINYANIIYFNNKPTKFNHEKLIYSIINFLPKYIKNPDLYKLPEDSFPYVEPYPFKLFIKTWKAGLIHLRKQGNYLNAYPAHMHANLVPIKMKSDTFSENSNINDYINATIIPEPINNFVPYYSV